MPASAGQGVSLHFFVPRQDGAYSIVSVPAAPIISFAAVLRSFATTARRSPTPSTSLSVHSLSPSLSSSHRPLRLPFPLRRKALRISWGLASPFRLLRLVHYLLRLRYLRQLRYVGCLRHRRSLRLPPVTCRFSGSGRILKEEGRAESPPLLLEKLIVKQLLKHYSISMSPPTTSTQSVTVTVSIESELPVNLTV